MTTRQDPLSAALATLHNTGSALRAVAGRAERDILADIIAAHNIAVGTAGAISNQSGLAGLDLLIRGALQPTIQEFNQMAIDIKQEIAAFAVLREQLTGLVSDVESALEGAALPQGATVISQADGEALQAERQGLQTAVEQMTKALPNSQVQVAGASAASASAVGDTSAVSLSGTVDTGSNIGHPSSGLE